MTISLTHLPQDAILKDKEEPIIKALKDPSFNIMKSFKTSSTPLHPPWPSISTMSITEMKWKIAEYAKIKKKEQLKKKKKKTNHDSNSNNIQAAQPIKDYDSHANSLQHHQPQHLQA